MIIQRPFYLMRHAQTVANTSHTACGLFDSSLTKEGISQAKAISFALDTHLRNIKTIYHSSLSRSKETANHLKEAHDIHLVEVLGLNEQSFGTWEGLPWEEVLVNLKKGKQPPGGESRVQFSSRIKENINYILSSHSPDSIPLIIAHGGTFFALGHLFGYEVEDISNCYTCCFQPSSCQKDSLPWETLSFCSVAKKFIPQTIYYKPPIV
jgi:probable phosphoglycerate mutase